MRILVLGGTGAMGVHLVRILSDQGNEIYVTSRKRKVSENNSITYIQGNAHELEFVESLLEKQFDVIVDFMVYTEDEFKQRVEKFLSATKQYIFLSSCRVYAETDGPITEKSSRILDVCMDEEYLRTGEYALAKARQENLLIHSEKKNWTIIRPYITYSDERLQLGAYEKEQWLERAIRGKTIVFSEEITKRTTTMTSGMDVAMVMAKLIGNEKARGECIQIAGPENKTWREILEIYLKVIERKTSKTPRVLYIDNNTVIEKIMRNQYQVKYDRLYNRRFDSEKVNQICDEEIQYCGIEQGLVNCLEEFLDNRRVFKNKSWELDAYMDKVSGERTVLSDIPSMKEKMKYIIARYLPYFRIAYRDKTTI